MIFVQGKAMGTEDTNGDIAPGSGVVYTDNLGQIWFQSDKPGVPPQLLDDIDSLCGVWPFETGPSDPFRTACGDHDNCYQYRCFFEVRGWNRASIDSYFLGLCLELAGDSQQLKDQAYTYYGLVRIIGEVVYYRHPTIGPGQVFLPELLDLTPEQLLIYCQTKDKEEDYLTDFPNVYELFKSKINV